jgi:hypothetical protein
MGSTDGLSHPDRNLCPTPSQALSTLAESIAHLRYREAGVSACHAGPNKVMRVCGISADTFLICEIFGITGSFLEVRMSMCAFGSCNDMS